MSVEPTTSTLADDFQAAHPEVDLAAVLAEPGRSSIDELRDELLERGYEVTEIDLVAPAEGCTVKS